MGKSDAYEDERQAHKDRKGDKPAKPPYSGPTIDIDAYDLGTKGEICMYMKMRVVQTDKGGEWAKRVVLGSTFAQKAQWGVGAFSSDRAAFEAAHPEVKAAADAWAAYKAA